MVKKKEILTVRGIKVVFDNSDHRYKAERQGPYRQNNWLVLTKSPDCGRGEYAEELDVTADTKTHAKQIAEAVLTAHFDPSLTVSRIIYQGPTY